MNKLSFNLLLECKVGKVFYNLDVKIDVLSDTQEGELTHVIFKLHFKNDYFNTAPSSTNISMISGGHHHRHIAANLPIKSEIFFELFPFHVVFKKNMEIISIGDGLAQAMKHAEGESIKDLFNLARPLISFTWENVNIFYLLDLYNFNLLSILGLYR